MSRATFAVLAAIACTACNLPTDADSARERLADRTESTAAFAVSFPVVHFDPVDFLTHGDSKLNVLLGTTAESIRYPTNWREIDVSPALSSFEHWFGVQASDFGPEFGAMLELVRIQNVVVRFEIENTGNEPVSFDGIEVAVRDAAGTIVNRSVPADSVAAGVVAGNSKHFVDVPATALADLLMSEIAHGRNLNVSVSVHHVSIAAANSRLRTRAVLLAPILVEFGSREVEFRHVMHEKFRGDEELLKDLHSLEVDSAWLELEVDHALPIALRGEIAIAPTPLDTSGYDPLTSPDRLQVETIRISAAAANADGSVTSRALTHISILLSNATVELLRSGVVSLGGAFTITANTDRVRIGPNNTFELKASARIRVKHKGT